MMPLMVDEEQKLLQRVRNDETAALQEFVERYKKQLYFLALDLTGNHHDAEDLSQDVFLKALNSIRKFRGDSKVSSWLHRITVNTYLDERRKKSFRIMKMNEPIDQDHSELAVADSSPQKDLERKRLQQEIDQALGSLSPQQKSVFVLRHYKDMKLREIADVLQLSEGTVKSVLFRAIRKLQEALSEYRFQPKLEEAQ